MRAARLLVLAAATAALVSCGWAAGAPTRTRTSSAPPSPATTAPPAPPASAALPWPTYGADPARLRAVPAPGLRPPFRREWTFHGRALLELPPVVGYGSVFEEAFDGRLYAIDPATGAIRWRYFAHRCGWASPSLGDGLVFASFIAHPSCHSTFHDGELLAFAQSSGRIVWRRRLGPSESSPLATNAVVYVADQSGYVYAFAAGSGRRLWRTDTGAPIKASPSLADGRIFVGDYGGTMLALDARTGRILWRNGGHGNIYSSAAVSAGRVFAGSLDDGIYAFSARTGETLWSVGTGGYVYASPAVWRGLVLVGSYDGTFYALHAETGATAWRFDAHAPISGAASVIDGVVYLSTFAHRTYALAAGSGRLLEEWNDGEYSPAVAGYGRLYLVGLGRIYALEGT